MNHSCENTSLQNVSVENLQLSNINLSINVPRSQYEEICVFIIHGTISDRYHLYMYCHLTFSIYSSNKWSEIGTNEESGRCPHNWWMMGVRDIYYNWRITVWFPLLDEAIGCNSEMQVINLNIYITPCCEPVSKNVMDIQKPGDNPLLMERNPETIPFSWTETRRESPSEWMNEWMNEFLWMNFYFSWTDRNPETIPSLCERHQRVF